MRWRRRRLLVGLLSGLGLWCLLSSSSGPSAKGQDPRAKTDPPRPVYRDENIPAGCECKDATTGQLYDFCYHPHFDKSKRGRRFDCAHLPTVQRLGLVASTGFLELERDALPEPVFVSGSSDSHFSEQVRLVDTVQKFLPKARIAVYDLGLSKPNVERLRTLCQVVEVRGFNTSAYPKWVGNLHQYRWKPIIIAEALKEFRAVWWLDSSVVFKKDDLSHVYALLKCRNTSAIPSLLRLAPEEELRKAPEKRDELWVESGWHVPDWALSVTRCHKFSYLLQGFTGHGIFPATHAGVFEWLPTDMRGIRRKTAKMYEAGFLFTAYTAEAVRDVLRWYVLCALEDTCMAPRGASLGCRWKGADRYEESAGCHRFDQSVVNLLLANRNAFDRRHYTSSIVDFFNIQRGASQTKPKVCRA